MKFSGIFSVCLVLAPLSQSCLLPEGRNPALRGLIRRQTDNNGLAIGTGDRFNNGTLAPRGLGTQPAGTDLGTILSIHEIESAFRGLAKEYNLETFESPYKTLENRTLYGGRIGGKFGGKCTNSYRAF